MNFKKFLLLIFIIFGFSAKKAFSETFSIVLIPDTQKYTVSEDNMKNFNSQLDWIIKNIQKEKIVFISHVGDVIHSPIRLDLYRLKMRENCLIYRSINLFKTEKRWHRANKALYKLDINNYNTPYSIVPGNHDYDCPGENKEKRTTKTFLKYFGPERYNHKKWFLSNDITGRNMAQKFKANGKSYIHIGLEWLSPDYAIEFAQNIIIKNPTIPVIITTHSHIGRGNPAKWISYLDDSDEKRKFGYNNSEQLFKKLVEPFPQVFFVLSGHIQGDGILQSETILNQNVYQVLANYSNDPQGGNGWLKLVKFDPDNSKFNIQITSPTYENFKEGYNRANDKIYNTSFNKDINSLHAFLTNHSIKHFRKGQYLSTNQIYKSAVDINIKEKNIKNSNREEFTNILLKFENIIGNSSNQIPPKTKIEKAILTLTSEGDERKNQQYKVYKMLKNWHKYSEKNNIKKYIKESENSKNLSFVISEDYVNGTDSFDVTADIQSWVNGEPNNGWVFNGKNGDLRRFKFSESERMVERPMLTIIYKENP